MKRFGDLYHLVYDMDNLKSAIVNAAKGKTSRSGVRKVLSDIDSHALMLQDMLIRMDFELSPCNKETIIGCNGKSREIVKPKFFPDLCLQRALMQVINPIILRSSYEYAFGCMPGRGTMQAKKAVEKWVRKDPKYTKYCLVMDIHKCFPSISTFALRSAFCRKFKDDKLLWLIDKFINVQDRGVPLGFYTSPWFCSFILQGLDHKIKEEFGAKYYARYVDDMVIFGNNKKELHKIRLKVAEHLKTLGLELNDNWQVFRYEKNRVLDFVGYRFYRDHTLVRKKIAQSIRDTVRKANKRIEKGRKPTYRQAAALMSLLGWTKHGDCYSFYQKNIVPYFGKDLTILKSVIRRETYKRLTT